MKKPLLAIGVAVVAAGLFLVLRNARRETSVPNPATGLVTHISAESISIETNDGHEFMFTNRAEHASVAHLQEHQTDKEPVSIIWHEEDDEKIATHIGDVR